MKFLLAQTRIGEDGVSRYTGHAVLFEAPTPHDAASALVEKLKKEGAQAVIGSLGHNVWEDDDPEGRVWFWLERSEAHAGRFGGIYDLPAGSYYRPEPKVTR